MLTLIGVVLWLAPHALGAAGVVVLASPLFDSCDDKCAREVFERRSHCEAQFPEPGQEDAYKACLSAAEDFKQTCVGACNACNLACESKATACTEACPCGVDSPCLQACNVSFSKCSEYCGLARRITAKPCDPEPAPEPPPAPASEPALAPAPAPEPAPATEGEWIEQKSPGGVD